MRLIFALCALLAAPAVFASQIVAMDVDPAGGVKKRIATALTPMLHSELSRVQGISLITQDDIRAMLKLDATKGSVGCDDSSCLADIAGALGAELLVTAKLGRVGRSYNLTLTLIQVDGAQVLRRVNGQAKGSEEAAGEALQSAVGQLFSGELPEAARGPDSLSLRAYRAALAGLRSVTADPNKEVMPSRKRIILDLVRTELDFDVEPKMTALQYEVARGKAEFRGHLAMAKNAKTAAHFNQSIATYSEVFRDLQRVKEIRERARARGIVPSSRALRFEQGVVEDMPSAEKSKAYKQAHKKAVAVMKRALKAWNGGDREAFAATWAEEDLRQARNEFDRYQARDKDRGIRWHILSHYAQTPEDFERLVDAFEPDKKIRFMRLGVRRGAFHDTDTVYMEMTPKGWRVSSW